MTFMRAAILWAGLVLFSACSSYRQSLFLTVDKTQPASVIPPGLNSPSDLSLRPFDQFQVDVYAASGELLIDPENALAKAAQADSKQNQKVYGLDKDGTTVLPMIGEVKLAPLSLRQAEDVLREKYNAFYRNCYVAITLTSQRVTVISTSGVMVPLQNNSLTLLEVIALAGEVTRESKTKNIRVLRGNEVLIIDLSKISHYPTNNIIMQPGDIVYMEPIKRPFAEGTRDIAPLLGLLVGILTLVWFISQ